MVTAAAGPISTIEDLAADTLAATTFFQSLTGTANATAAKARIYFDALPPPGSNADTYTLAELQTLRPYAIINTEPQGGFRWHHDGAGVNWTFGQNGTVTIEIEADIASGDLGDPQEYMRLFKNTIGQIVRTDDTGNPGLLELAGQVNYLPIREAMFYGPFRGAEEERKAQGDYLVAMIDLNWGLLK